MASLVHTGGWMSRAKALTSINTQVYLSKKLAKPQLFVTFWSPYKGPFFLFAKNDYATPNAFFILIFEQTPYA